MDEFVWKDVETQWSSYPTLYLGKYIVIYIEWDSFSGRTRNKYIVKNKLPGLKADLGSYNTINEAKARAEAVLTMWLTNTNLTVKT